MGFIIIITIANKINKQAYATDSIIYISGIEHAIISNDFKFINFENIHFLRIW